MPPIRASESTIKYSSVPRIDNASSADSTALTEYPASVKTLRKERRMFFSSSTTKIAGKSPVLGEYINFRPVKGAVVPIKPEKPCSLANKSSIPNSQIRIKSALHDNIYGKRPRFRT